MNDATETIIDTITPKSEGSVLLAFVLGLAAVGGVWTTNTLRKGLKARRDEKKLIKNATPIIEADIK